MEGGDVVVSWDVGPVAFEDVAGVRVDFALSDDPMARRVPIPARGPRHLRTGKGRSYVGVDDEYAGGLVCGHGTIVHTMQQGCKPENVESGSVCALDPHTPNR